MTAIVVVRHRDSVHLLSDGLAAELDIRGADRRFPMVKAWPLPHLNMVVATMGPVTIGLLLVSVVCANARTYEAARAVLPEAVKSVTDHVVSQGTEVPSWNAIIAGIGEAGPDSAMVSTHGMYGTPPYEVVDIGPIALLPFTEAMRAKLWLPETPDEFDPYTDGRWAMEVQRETEIPNDLGLRTGKASIGEFIQLTSVRADGITTKVIHRWTD